MFLPFLPLILASAGLTLFSRELERTEPWLNLPLAVNMSLIILFSFLLAQMPQWLRQFSKFKQFPEVRKGSYSSTKFSRPRTLILIVWLALVYGEHLDLRIGHLFNNITEAESVSFGVLLLLYWLADAVAAIPVYQWNAHGLEEKIKKSVLHLRLQLPVLALIIIQTVWFWITSKFLLSFTSNWSLIFELLFSLILMVLVAPVVFVKSWGAKAIENGNDFEEIRKELENSRTPVTAILSWPDSIMPYSTAGVIGFVRGFRYLLISPQLLKSLSATELRAVTAHEAGHLRKQHLLFYLLAFICLLELFAFAGSANLLLTWTGVLEVSGMLMGVASLAIIGGHLKLLDSAIFYQLVGGNVHQLEFEGEFQARLVENGYNRLPVFVVEGSIRNTFNESDQIKKIQLKAFAFDADQQLIANHFTYAGTVLSDEQLESLSPMHIKALRHSSEFGIQDSTALTNDKNDLLNTTLPQAPLIPFQVVFIKSVATIKKTSLQIVSYVRNNKIVYVHAPNL